MDIALLSTPHRLDIPEQDHFLQGSDINYYVLCGGSSGDRVDQFDLYHKPSSIDSESIVYGENESEFDKRIRDGDIITLELDLEKKIMHLLINDRRFCHYFKIKMDNDTEYKIGMSVSQGTSFTIVDFQTY